MKLKDASILVVDDEPVLLEIFSAWFRREAGQVFCAANGAEALEVLGRQKIDLIITDVRMPVMDGITLLKRINAIGLHYPSVIFISGFTDFEARDAYDLGAEALLEKPVERDDLANAAQRCLEDRNELWKTPRDFSLAPVFNCAFAGLDEAVRDHQIAFGRGGFCVTTKKFLVEGPVNIQFDFTADGYVLAGQGVVRWVAHQEQQMGIELIYVADQSRARAVQLTEGAASFIPRSTGRLFAARVAG